MKTWTGSLLTRTNKSISRKRPRRLHYFRCAGAILVANWCKIERSATSSVAANVVTVRDAFRKIDRAIAQISKDAAKLQKNLNASAVSTIKLTNLPPRTSIEACNMTYDRLQGIVEQPRCGCRPGFWSSLVENKTHTRTAVVHQKPHLWSYVSS